jgi:3-dehydroquinate synthetase
MEKLSRDKKFRDGGIRFVLLRALGDAFVSAEVTAAHLEAAIERLRGPAGSGTAATAR